MSQACHLKLGDLRYMVHPRAFLAALAASVISPGSSPRIRQVPPCMQSLMPFTPVMMWVTALSAFLPHGQQRTCQPLCLSLQVFNAIEAPEHHSQQCLQGKIESPTHLDVPIKSFLGPLHHACWRRPLLVLHSILTVGPCDICLALTKARRRHTAGEVSGTARRSCLIHLLGI